MDLKYFIFSFLLCLHYQFIKCNTESITYISTEHPAITWSDPTYFDKGSFTSSRLSRQDPRYYVELIIVPLFTMGNNIMVDFYFYQFLTNRYRPSFVEMHFRFCDMVENNVFFGTALKQAFGNKTCPFPPGEYILNNMSIPYVPKGFPFTKGRIYCNLTLEIDGGTKYIAGGHIDMEVKVGKIKKKH